jgi:hypothetical protein
MKPQMTLNDHLTIADDLAIAAHHLTKVFLKCQLHYPSSGRLMKLLRKFAHNLPSSEFSQVKSLLDSSYHELITDEQFREHGHIYYELEARHEALTKFNQQRNTKDLSQNEIKSDEFI